MHGVLQDVRIAVRFCVRQPGFAGLAILMLALGIGANTATFGVVSHTLLVPLPFAEPDQLVTVWETLPSENILTNTPAPSTLNLWRARSHDAVAFAAYTTGTVNLTGGGEPERLSVLRTSADLPSVLGVRPALGRTFRVEEDRFGGARVVILSHQLWVRRFQRDPTIVGRTIALNGQGAAVIGVLPEDVPLTIREVDAWVPLALMPSESRNSRMLFVLARLRPGASPATLRAELDQAMHQPGPESMPAGIGVNVRPMDEELRGGVRPDLVMIFAVTAIVLLIACANVATMLLARGIARQRELTVRAALGATRLRLARMLLIESAVLGLAGCLAGLVVALGSLRVMLAALPPSLASTIAGGLDGRVLAFAMALGLLASLLFGVAPVLGASGRTVLAQTRTGDDERPLVRRVRQSLVVLEVALAVVLLTGAALLARGYATLIMTPTGFSPDGVLTAQIFRADADDDRRLAFYQRLVTDLAAVPTVRAAGLSNGIPIRFTGGGSGFQIDDRRTPTHVVSGHHRIVSAGYFAAMSISMTRGATFGADAESGREPVVVVSQSFADAAWARTDPIGRHVRWGAEGDWMRVVGVVADIRLARSLPIEPHVYLPFTQVKTPFYPPSDVVLKTAGAPLDVANAVRDIVRHLDPNQPVASIMTLDDLLDRSMGRRRFTLTLMGTFAALALVLAIVGIHGVLSYLVGRRTHEIGIRLALGATTGQVRHAVLQTGLGLALLGLIVGVLASLGLARWASALVPGLSTPAFLPMVGTAALLVLAAAAACDGPARRAMRVDPVTALRAD